MNAKRCTDCDSNSHVRDVRNRGDRVWRRRECTECGNEWITYEINTDLLEQYETFWESLTERKVTE